ncbi:alpha/beta hydrolase family protein [Terriglobus roseus]|uniref:Acetyl xylan esterase (AXE1) n=1 Tax=Terriglobus roseus TaxID=392734 RepID=A0A1H4SL21_9BACT|nr:prolyl oligopeptidase family serine peptidase [Terriglobus roseus]SEC44737.1 Acetyl xylan esterase (AXE1) [Terriglobus roseus]
MRRSLSRLVLAFAWPIAAAGVSAQVAAGGGGNATPQQFFSVQPPFNAGDFVRPGRELSTTQRRNRNAAWRAEIRKQLYVPNKLPALEAKVWSTFSPMPGVIADRVTYATADGMRVPAIVYRPDPKLVHGKLPGVVIVNGHGGDKFSWYSFYSGMLFAKAGAVAVTYDPIGEGERNHQRLSAVSPSEHDAAVDLPHWGQRLAGLMQVDVMQGVSYLRSLPQVDPARIGTVGYSMGAFITGITGAIDPRIHAVLLSGGGTFDGPNDYFDTGKLPCQAAPYRALGVLGDRGPILYTLNAERGPMFVMNGDADTVMKMADHPPSWFAAVRERTIAMAGTDTNLFTTVLYPGISHRTSWVDLDGMLWLNHQLHFAFWDDAAIRAAGTTHVSTWIHANNVTISPNYIREDREGGLDAVGTSFPGIPRQDLMVLPDAEWQKQKDVLLYDAWAAKTRRTEQPEARAAVNNGESAVRALSPREVL